MFEAIYAQLLKNPFDSCLVEGTVEALSLECTKANTVLVNKLVVSKSNTPIIASIVNHRLVHHFADFLQGWIQMLLTSLNV
jgi:hypothetical protein